jgi:hypothetical protein
MNQRLDSETARLLWRTYESWYGPPLLEYDGEIIDGRVRFREGVSLGYLDGRTQPTTAKPITHGAIVRFLLAAGHIERARTYLPPGITSLDDVAAFVGCERSIVAPLCVRKRVTPMKAHTTPKRRQAIEAIGRALREAEQTTGHVTTERLREIMGPWL